MKGTRKKDNNEIFLFTFAKAYAMDNTDVHFMSKFARIALEQRHMDLAGVIFKRVN